MNNPMIILIGLAIAAVGTLVAVNVVLPMLSRAEAQAIASETNTLAGAIWEAKRQNITDWDEVVNIRHLLSGWTCSRVAPVATCNPGTTPSGSAGQKFDNSQIDGGFLLAGTAPHIQVLFKDGATQTCLSAGTFLHSMSSPFFRVLKATGSAAYAGAIADLGATGAAGCAASTPVLRLAMR